MHIFLDMFRRNGESDFLPVTKAGSTDAMERGASSSGGCGGRPWLGLCGHCPVITMALDNALDSAPSLCKRLFLAIFCFIDYTGRNFGQACFCNNPFSGFIMIIALFVAMPNVAISGLIASTISMIFALVIHQPRASVSAGLSGFNGVLLGTVLPVVLLPHRDQVEGPGMQPDAVWLVAGVAAAVSVVLTNSLGHALGSLRPSLPSLSLPFNLLAVLTTTVLGVRHQLHPLLPSVPTNVSEVAVARETAYVLEGVDVSMLLQGGLLGVGQVFAVQDLWCSGLVLIGMLVCSPLLAVAGLVGSFMGTFIGAAVSPTLYELAYAGLFGYNGFLTACAVCFFYVPTWRIVVLALTGVVLTAMGQVALAWVLSDVGLPVFSLPFVMSSLLVLSTTTDALPRPVVLSFPELHRALWRSARRDSLMSAPPASPQDTSSTSICPEAVFLAEQPSALWRSARRDSLSARDSLCSSPQRTSMSSSTFRVHRPSPSLNSNTRSPTHSAVVLARTVSSPSPQLTSINTSRGDLSTSVIPNAVYKQVNRQRY